MTNRILTDIGWQDRVRNILGVDEAYLGDADIEMPDVIDIAESNIIAIIPGYASLVGNERIWIESATVCECATLLCSTMKVRVPVREQGPHFTRELDYDWDKRRDELRKERDAMIGKIATWIAVPHFGRTKG